MNPMPPTIILRPSNPEDEPFFKALLNEYDSERLCLGWMDETPEAEDYKKGILEQNFKARTKDRAEANWDKKNCVIELNGQSVGQVILMQDSEEIRVADLIVSSAQRGMGIGHAVLQSIQAESDGSKRPIRLHVEKMNTAAISFYEHMGFRLLEDRITHYFMEWVPPSMQGTKLYFPGQG